MENNTIPKNIIDELNLSGLPEDKQEQLLSAMTESVLKEITIAVLKRLSDDEKVEFDKVRETGDSEKINKFLKDKIKDYDKMVEKIIEDFKNEMKSTISELEKNLND